MMIIHNDGDDDDDGDDEEEEKEDVNGEDEKVEDDDVEEDDDEKDGNVSSDEVQEEKDEEEEEDVAEDDVEDNEVEDGAVKGEEGVDVENDDVEEEEADNVGDDDVEEEDRSQNLGPHFVRACAVEMHFNISQEPLFTWRPRRAFREFRVIWLRGTHHDDWRDRLWGLWCMIWVKNPEERSIHTSLKRRNSSSILGAHIFDSYLSRILFVTWSDRARSSIFVSWCLQILRHITRRRPKKQLDALKFLL